MKSNASPARAIRAAILEWRAGRAAQVPELSVEEVDILPGSIHEGGFGRIYRARVHGEPYIAKRYKRMDELSERELFFASKRFARSVLLRETPLATVAGAETPRAYLFDEHEVPITLTHEYDVHTGLFCAPLRARVLPQTLFAGQHAISSRVALEHIVLSALSTIVESHTHGVIHRDIKPENLLVHYKHLAQTASIANAREFLDADRAAPAVAIIDWDGAYLGGDDLLARGGVTTQDLSFIRTSFFLPFDILFHPTPENMREHRRDTVAMAVSAALLYDALSVPTEGHDYTSIEHRDTQLGSDTFTRRAQALGIPELSTVLCYGIRSGYAGADGAQRFLDDLCDVFDGRRVTNPAMRKVWSARTVAESALYEESLTTHARTQEREHTRKRTWRQALLAGVAVAVGAPALYVAGACAYDALAYPSTLEGVARAYNHNPENLDAAIAEQSTHMMQDILLPHAHTEQKELFPVGQLATLSGKIQYCSGEEEYARYLFDLLLAQASQPHFLEWAAQYAPHMQLTLESSRTTVDDSKTAAISRFTPFITLLPPLLSHASLPAPQRVPLENAEREGLAAGAIALRHYHPLWGTFSGVEAPTTDRLKINAWQQNLWLPFMVAIANSAQVDSMLDPLHRLPEHRALAYMREQHFTPLSHDDLSTLLARSAQTACTCLVRQDPADPFYGWSYSSAQLLPNGSCTEQKFLTPTGDQYPPGAVGPLVLQDHAGLLRSISLVSAFLHSHDVPASSLDSCIAALEHAYERSVFGVPRELIIPAGVTYTGRNQTQDALALIAHAEAAHARGAQNLVERDLALIHTQLTWLKPAAHTPFAPRAEYTFGLFPDTGHVTWIGSFTEPMARYVVLQEEQKKRK